MGTDHASEGISTEHMPLCTWMQTMQVVHTTQRHVQSVQHPCQLKAHALLADAPKAYAAVTALLSDLRAFLPNKP